MRSGNTPEIRPPLRPCDYELAFFAAAAVTT